MQTPLRQGWSLDAVSSGEYLLGSAKIDISRGEIVQGFMVTLVVVVIHKTSDLSFKLCGKIVILQVHNVLHRAVVALDLALRHRVSCLR